MFKKLFALSLFSTASAADLTIYAYDSFTSEWGAGTKIEKSFEELCGCDIEFVPFEDGITMFNRLRLEGSEATADIVLGLDNHLVLEAEKSGLFVPPKVDLSTLKINWENTLFVPFDYAQYAFIYDKNKLTNPPKSLDELINDQKIRVIYQDPRTSTVGRGLLLWINALYGDKSSATWEKLAKHTVTVAKGWSESYGAFLKGESDVVLSYNTSPLYHLLQEQKDNYVALDFSEGGVLQIEVAGKTKHAERDAKTSALADKFLQHLLSDDTQKVIALSNVMLPVTGVDVAPEYKILQEKQAATKILSVENNPETMKDFVHVWVNAVSK